MARRLTARATASANRSFVGNAVLTPEGGLEPLTDERWRFRSDVVTQAPWPGFIGPKVVALLAVSVGDEEEPFDGAVHLDRYLVEEQIQRLVESADAARSAWEELRRSARPARWEGEDDLFDPGLADELDTLVFEVMQTAEIAWKLLDDANLDYSRRLEVHEEAQHPLDDEE
jgi:hypothetical protein